MTRFNYTLIVEDEGDTSTAYLSEVGSPIRGCGSTPLEAIAALCECIKQWPSSGADRWLNTPVGTQFARQFCPGFEPGKPGAKS